MENYMDLLDKRPPVFETWRICAPYMLISVENIENVGKNEEWSEHYGWLCPHKFDNNIICKKCGEGKITMVVVRQSNFHLGHELIDWISRKKDIEYMDTLQGIRDSCSLCPPDRTTYCALCNPYDDWTEDKQSCDFCFDSRNEIDIKYLESHPVKCFECGYKFGIGDYVCHMLVVDNHRKLGISFNPPPEIDYKLTKEPWFYEKQGVCRKCTTKNKTEYKTALYPIDQSLAVGDFPSSIL